MQDFHSCTARQTAAHLKSNPEKGLKRDARQTRLENYGHNILPQAPSQSVIIRFLLQFKNFMILILLIAAGLSFFASYLEGRPDFVEPGIILAILIIKLKKVRLFPFKVKSFFDIDRNTGTKIICAIYTHRIFSFSKFFHYPVKEILLTDFSIFCSFRKFIFDLFCQVHNSLF